MAAMMGYTKVTPEEKAKIISYLRCGMPQKQICELTKRTPPTIRRIKIELESEKTVETEKTELNEPLKPLSFSIADSDYARAKAKGDKRWANDSLKIDKSMTIESSKTQFTYRTKKSDEFVEICIDGATIKIPKNKMESFADELIDVAIELSNY